jgi:hypothetical protein
VNKLSSRIRGWFPREPYLISTRSKIKQENRPPPPIIPAYKLSAIKFAGGYAIFWIIFYGLMFFAFNPGRYPISGLQVAVWVIAGSAIGIFSGAAYTKNQLRRLMRDYQIFVDGKDIALLGVPIILFTFFVFLVSLSIPSSIGVYVSQGLMISVYSWGDSFVITRTIQLATFERRENMRIMQSWWNTDLVLIPKAPDSFLNNLKVSDRRDSIGSLITV